MTHFDPARLDRRAFIFNGSLFLLGGSLGASHASSLFADDPRPKLRVGLVTDLHYADKPAAGTRHYRESIAKLGEAAARFRKDRTDFVVELGDLVDAADSADVEKGYLKRINKDFAALPGEKHYVLGNHCVQTLTKEEFLEGVGRDKAHYSFDVGGFHFVILDACFRADGQPYGRKNFTWTDTNIPPAQIEWLQADLKKADGKAVVCVHQRLDVGGNFGVKNAPQVRKVLEESGKVLAVFQGHSHKNDYRQIAGIHYCVLTAMVEGSGAENNGYSLLDVFEDGTLRLSGYRKQQNHEWPNAKQ